MITVFDIKIHNEPAREEWPVLMKRPLADSREIIEKVSVILDDVQQNGDLAIRKYNSLFDDYHSDDFLVSTDELSLSSSLIDPSLKEAIDIAIKNISTFHLNQQSAEMPVITSPGVTCWRKSVPIEKVGLYIPGGSAPLFSSLLMLAIPAQLAGCRQVVVCTPPGNNGKVHPVILYCCHLLGVRNVFTIGGAQAIAAMAFGTENVPRADKIFGPGNQFVNAAKMMIQQSGTAIDLPAGPSEVLIYADETADASFIASDLLSQAEHGADSQVVVITSSLDLLIAVKNELFIQLETLPRKILAASALENARLLLFSKPGDAIDFINAYAPEHLIIATENAEEIAELVVNAGSVFLGNLSAESFGDYASGTNHTLPTNGAARAYSGVSLESFQKKISFQRITKEGLQKLGPAVSLMAEAEGLLGHKNAVELRLNKTNNEV